MVNQNPDLLNKCITMTERGIIIKIIVTPNSKEQGIEGVDQWRGALKVRIKAPAQKGKANSELIEFLSYSLSVPSSDISIKAGETSRLKELEICGLNEKDLGKLVSENIKVI
jgi:uncharacterized protein (TIGR00251 family)